MKMRWAQAGLLSLAVMLTSVVCSFIPLPTVLAPTTEPLQQTVDTRLTGIAGPQPSITPTQPTLPTLTPLPSATALPATPTRIRPGGIAGSLAYPSSYLPPLRIVAFRIGDNSWFSLETPQNAKNYQLGDLEPGKYFVVAYLQNPASADPGFAGGYTRAVPCGLTVKCTDHALIEVEVLSGQITRGINPSDWYAPRGSFPKNPTLP